MDNIFTADTGKSLFYKRFIRLSQFTRLPLRLSLSIVKYYLKKMLGIKGTARESANNYYFLTLINSQSQHKKSEGELFCFRNYSGFSFYARQNPSSDLEVFNQVWGRKEYHYATGKLKEAVSKDAAVHIIDAGANVGYSTLFFLQEFPNARIVSIEPDTENFSVLEKNITSNNLGGQVTPEKKGIWNKTCNLKVVDTFRDGFSWSKQVVETTESTGLQAVSLSAIIEQQKWQVIDLLKIDIEGSEKQVFDDEQGIQYILPMTKVIALEIHDEIADRKKIYDILTRYGFTHFDVEGSDLTIAYNPLKLV